MTEQRGSAKFFITVALVGAAMVGLVVRLVVLHVGAGDQDRSLAVKTRTFKQTLANPRGRILEGSPAGGIMALNVAVKDIWVDPAPLIASNRVGSTMAGLRSLLEFDVNEVTARLSRTNNRYTVVARQVPDELAERVAALKLPGVHMDDTSVRSYPQGHAMCHVLGFVNAEKVGTCGLEQSMEKYLQGVPGLIESQLDGRRREMVDRRVQEVPPREGADVVLTIDQNLQYIMEKELDEMLVKSRAEAGFAILQRVRTGEILAMASRPAFDPNAFRTATDEEKRNRAISLNYDPGSTFKPAVVAAALDDGLVTPDTVFDTENGRWLYQKRVLRDDHPFPRLTVAGIIQKSSNIGTAKIAIMLGDQRLYQRLRAFNIGSKLGIDLPGEEAGILNPLSRWSAISSSRIAIGQGVAVTGIQMLGVMSAIANDGVLMKPFVIRKVVAADGTELVRHQPEVIGRPIRAETARTMRRILAGVCDDGTGKKARIRGMRVAGKTGTAQKVVNGRYSETDYMASFAGFLPAYKPELAMIVVYDSPQPVHYGAQISAPVFSKIAEQAVRYLGIIPEGEDEIATPPPETGATEIGERD